jgi:O-acetylhomoserine (thiol)-lyase
MLKSMLPRFGITTTFVDPNDVANFEAAVQDNTRLIFAESLGNPKLDVLDLAAISKVAKKHKVPFMVDNTVATPALLKPIEHGVNIVIHSLTKYLNGNGTSMGGVVIDAGTFDWSSGKFPEFTSPSPSYHGLNYHEALGPAAYIARIRIEGLRDLGAAISPFNAFQIIQGIETLSVRMQRHSQNALELATWLSQNESVAWVNYPGLASSKYNGLAKKYLKDGQSGVVTFGVKGGFEAAKKIADNTKIFSLLANFGDSKSLIIHNASTTHQQLTPEQQEDTGVTNDLIRLSVGLEDVDDLKADLQAAFDTL